MIELTLEQRKAVSRQDEIPPRAIDADTQTTYVLIREEVYDRLKGVLAVDEPSAFAHDACLM